MSEADKIIESLKNSGRKVEEFYTGNKTSDKNVANVTKNDIDILNTLIYVYEARLPNYNKLMDSEVKSLKNILADYTRQKQINEEHQKINGELKERIKELEEANKIFALEGSKVRLSLYIKENYIPKQKIKEKIEEVKQIRRELGFKTYLKREHMLNEDREIVIKIQVLQELLQESEDK